MMKRLVWNDIPQSKRFHAPLRPDDSAEVTHGCRHTNPDICRKNSMSEICAFVREDGMCHSPPSTWSRQYAKLLEHQKHENMSDPYDRAIGSEDG